MWKEILLASAFALACGSTASLAQEPTGENMQSPPAASAPSDQSAVPSKEGAQADDLTGLPLYSSDGQKVGEVTAVKMSPDGNALQAEIGGFLGIGGKTVEIPAGSFQQAGDRVTLALTADEVGKLPDIGKQQ
jgi:sporulation protein YlmC with PRC-barrel domain